MEYRLVLLTLASLLCTQKHCVAEEIELCYIKKSSKDTLLCIPPRIANACCPERNDITVTVYRKDNCAAANVCKNGRDKCCTMTSQIDDAEEYRRALKDAFIYSMCVLERKWDNLSTMPNNSGLDLVKVSYHCPDDGTATPRVPNKESRPNVAAAVAVSVTIVVVGAVVVGTIFYMRRRRSRKDATEQRKEIHTNNAYIGSVSRSIDLHQNAQPSIKAEDQSTNHYYAEIADNSVHFNHSSTEDNEYQPIKPNERTATNGPPKNSFTTDKDPTREDEYDHLGTQDTPSSRANNYEHITHISKDDCHSYDKTEFNKGNTISLDDEDNYNHAQQSAAVERTETDDRDGGYSHVGGNVGGPEADDQYSTMESVMDTQDGSRHLNNYFVLEKQY